MRRRFVGRVSLLEHRAYGRVPNSTQTSAAPVLSYECWTGFKTPRVVPEASGTSAATAGRLVAARQFDQIKSSPPVSETGKDLCAIHLDGLKPPRRES